MALYSYIKQKPKDYSRLRSIVSSSLSIIGVLLILWVAYPIVSFEITSAVKFANVIKPIPESYSLYAVKNIQAVEPQVLSDQNNSLEDGTEVDYTNVANWFPKKPQEETTASGRIYFLSIPKLRINNAIVEIAGKSLDHTLIHYGGTGLPGDYGKAVIFGHSILPQFYNPKNYKAIFSLLPTLDKGDEIFVDFDGVKYRYVVSEMRVTTPEDVSVLEQRYDGSYVSLITCVPPGTYWKRLVVTARLENY